MIRVTTPTHIFTFPEDLPVSNCKTILVTYSQDTRSGLVSMERERPCAYIVMEKNKEDLTIDGQTVSYTLTQNETKMFKPNFPVYIQVRVLTFTDEALASDKIKVSVEDVLDDKILT